MGFEFIASRPSVAAPLVGLVLLAACAAPPDETPPSQSEEPAAVAKIRCENDRLTDFDRLWILAPHPDDEVLGFTGLADAFLKAGKEVDVWVVTDGDAYCEACALWKSGDIWGETCDAATFRNMETPEIDSFAEVRRQESTRAAEILGRPAPRFLGYPDTGLGASWANAEAGEPGKALRRSDFSACESCDGCNGGYGAGPETELSAETLRASLAEGLSKITPRTLVATTHWLDGHGDHAALGAWVHLLVSEMEAPPTVAFSVIHAHTGKNGEAADCWYPEPGATLCGCFLNEKADADPEWIETLRRARFQPESAQHLPGDAEYGEGLQLCLDPQLYLGGEATKLKAIESFESQLGTVGRTPDTISPNRRAMMDCNGYLISFVRNTEVFVLQEPSSPADDTTPATP